MPVDLFADEAPASNGAVAPLDLFADEEQPSTLDNVRGWVENTLPEWMTTKGMSDEERDALSGGSVGEGVANAAGGAISGIANMPKEVLQLGGAVSDATGITDSAYDTMSKIPSVKLYDKDSVAGQTAEVFAPALVGGGLGIKLASKAIPMAKAASKAGYVGRAAGIGAAGNVGSALTIDENEKGLLVGKDTLIPADLGFDETAETPAGTFLEKKGNQMMDAVGVGGAIDAGITGVRAAAGLVKNLFVSPILTKMSTTAQENWVADNLVRVLGQITPEMPVEEAAKRKEAVIAMLEKNKPAVLEWSKVNLDLKDVEVQRDLITYLTEVLHKENPEMFAAQISDLNNLGKAAAGPITQGVKQRPARAMEQSGQQLTELYGGTDEAVRAQRIQDAGPAIVKNVDEAVIRPAEESLGSARAQQQNFTGWVKEELKKDPVFMEAATRITKDVSPDLTKAGDDQATTITNNIFNVGKQIVKRKDELYNKIPKNIKPDASALEAAILEAGSSLNPKFLEQIKKASSLHDLEKIASFDLSREIDDLYSQGRGSVARDLIKFKRALTEGQLDALVARSPDNRAAKAIKAARDFYKTEMLPWRENPVLDKVLSSMQKNETWMPNVNAATDAFEGGIASASQGASGRAVADSMFDIMGKKTGGKFNKETASYIVTRYAEDLQRVINTKGRLEPEDIVDAIGKLETWAPSLGKADPASFNQLKGTLTKIRDGVVQQDALAEVVAQRADELEAAKKRVYDTILPDLAGRDGRVPNTYEGLKTIFTKPGNENVVDDILAASSSDPVVKDALKTAFNDILMNDQFFASSGARMSSGAKATNLNGINEFLNKGSSINNYSRKILGDEATDVYEEAARHVYNVDSVRPGKQDLGVEPTNISSDAASAINRVITVAFGVLNPTAARVRTITSAYSKGAETTSYVKEFMDKVIANTDLLVEVAKRSNKYTKPTISSQDMAAIRKAFTRAAPTYYGGEKTVDEQTEEAFGGDTREPVVVDLTPEEVQQYQEEEQN